MDYDHLCIENKFSTLGNKSNIELQNQIYVHQQTLQPTFNIMFYFLQY